jgi:UPF0176 protein
MLLEDALKSTSLRAQRAKQSSFYDCFGTKLMRIENIAGYKFIPLDELPTLRTNLLNVCQSLALKGTLLLSNEGINIFLAGTVNNISAFKSHLHTDTRFADITFRVSYSDTIPFKRLKIKLKKEIITLRQSHIDATKQRAPSLSPETFKQWLDEQRDITILDTRNEYETQLGTFQQALDLHLNDFCEFPNAKDQIPSDKPIVMFCTGGIRCEKASLLLLSQGYKEVYQLDGGILNYFEKVGSAHYTGSCFVFDDRVSLDANLNVSPAVI